MPVRLRKRADGGLELKTGRLRDRRLGCVTSLPRVCINRQLSDVDCWDVTSICPGIEGPGTCLLFSVSTALSVVSCLIVSLAELYLRNPAVPGYSSI